MNKNVDYFIEHAWTAEELKSAAYENYYGSEDLETKVYGLRRVLRCRFIMDYCCAKNNWGMIPEYKNYKAQWLKENSSMFDKQVLERI